MTKAKKNDRVKVHYTGKLKDGTIFDSSLEDEPIELTIGEEMLIPAFEEAVVGMAPGEKTTIEVPCEEAYGTSAEELIFEVDLEHFPGDDLPQAGDELEMVMNMDEDAEEGEEEVIPILVMEVKEDAVLINANHPLADEDLVFDIELVEIL